MSTQLGEGNSLLDVAGAANHLGVSEAFVRRLVLERRIRYFKVGKFVRFRAIDLDAFVEAGRQDPVELRVHVRSSSAAPRGTRARWGGRPGCQAGTQPCGRGAPAWADSGSDG